MMKNDESENSLKNDNTSKRQQIEGTALAVLMENRCHAFGNAENHLKKRLFNDVTNRQNNKWQKRIVQKTDQSQTSITNYAIVKHKPSKCGNLKKTIEEVEDEEKLRKIDSNGKATRPSSWSLHEMDIDEEGVDNGTSTLCDVNEIDMDELQNRFSQTLGKRFGVTEQEIPENKGEPQSKRWKEFKDEKKHLEDKAESSKGDENKENAAKKCNSMDYFCKSNYSLVTVQKPKILTAGFACIEKVVLKDLLKSMQLQEFIKKYALVDCRYPYEYDGGHIKGAVNIYDPAVLENTFFPECQTAFEIMIKKIPIFYCEYSSARGPVLASHLRKSDRVRNFDNYPFLYYNEIYVLQGGYNSFYNTDDNCFKELCEPKGYVSMQDKNHSNSYKMYHARNIRHGVGFETGMFQTAVIRKGADFRRTHSVPQMPESPTTLAFASVESPEKQQSEVPMLANPRTPTGRKKFRSIIN